MKLAFIFYLILVSYSQCQGFTDIKACVADVKALADYVMGIFKDVQVNGAGVMSKYGLEISPMILRAKAHCSELTVEEAIAYINPQLTVKQTMCIEGVVKGIRGGISSMEKFKELKVISLMVTAKDLIVGLQSAKKYCGEMEPFNIE